MPAFDELQPASFDGIPFVVSSVKVKGSFRHHTHTYPHAPNGDHEKLGRDPYIIEMTAHFSTEFVLSLYENAWPTDLGALFDRFELGLTSDLVVPTLGTIKAFAVDWSRDHSARNRSGETATFTFKEDTDETFLTAATVSIQYVSLATLAAAIVYEAKQAGLETDIFDAITEVAATAQAAVDQAELYADTVAGKIDQVTTACQSIQDTMKVLDEPPHWRVLEAVQNLGVASIQLQEDVLRRTHPVAVFTTVTNTTIQDISRQVYGDTSHAIDLMKLNAINDPFNIPPGTELRLYQP